MFSNRRSEYLEMRPPANPLLDALAQRLRMLDPSVVVQPATGGGWTAYYLKDRIVALARTAPSVTGGAIEIAFLPIDLAMVVHDRRDLDGERCARAIELAVQRAPVASPLSGTWAGGLSEDGFGAVQLIAGAVSWLARVRRERGAAVASGTQAELRILNAARGEAGRRANSLTIGCLAAIAIGFALTFVVIFVGAWLIGVGVPSDFAAALWLLLLIVPWLVFRWVRRRYPSPPQRTFERVAGFIIQLVVMLGILVLTAAIVFGDR